MAGGLHWTSSLKVLSSSRTQILMTPRFLSLQNRGSIFSGGVIITSSIYEATNTVHEFNWGRVGGGALKLVGGTIRLKNCKVNSNSASYGGGFDIANQKDFSTMYTEVIVEDSEVRDNVVPQTGAGFHLDTFDAVLFRNVTFANNTGNLTIVSRRWGAYSSFVD